jgi:general secretion pathway protein A
VDECLQAETLGLRCRTARGGLDELRQMNRPAVLFMRDNQGQEFYATLTRLDNQSATFTIGTETRTVALADLAEKWSGHYTLLWRMPPVASRAIKPGERGPDVVWLSSQLAQIFGNAAEPGKDPVFDEAMVRQVKQFQLVQGLTPDGSVGSQTMIRLSSAADLTAPKLSHEQGKK